MNNARDSKSDKEQDTFHRLAVRLELLLWAYPALENPHDSRHLPLASADHSLHRCRVSCSEIEGSVSEMLVY